MFVANDKNVFLSLLKLADSCKKTLLKKTDLGFSFIFKRKEISCEFDFLSLCLLGFFSLIMEPSRYKS